MISLLFRLSLVQKVKAVFISEGVESNINSMEYFWKILSSEGVEDGSSDFFSQGVSGQWSMLGPRDPYCLLGNRNQVFSDLSLVNFGPQRSSLSSWSLHGMSKTLVVTNLDKIHTWSLWRSGSVCNHRAGASMSRHVTSSRVMFMGVLTPLMSLVIWYQEQVIFNCAYYRISASAAPLMQLYTSSYTSFAYDAPGGFHDYAGRIE